MFPPIPLDAWSPSKQTLHRFTQIVGKIRLDQAPRRNHWWHIPFHLTGTGITTRPMGREVIFTIDFDFVAHRLVISTARGDAASFPLPGLSVAGFHDQLMSTLQVLDITPHIRAVPFDLADSTPFAEDTDHRSYDPFWVNRYWQVLSEVALVLEEWAGRDYRKTSPVHHFWHTFDVAVTRFSGRAVDQSQDVDAVSKDAYSHEVISAGFWFGDDQVPEPAFYCYTAPEPPGLTDEPLAPASARWVPSRGAHLALLTYDDARATADPRSAVLDFYESAYLAGALRAGWDIQALRTPYAPPMSDVTAREGSNVEINVVDAVGERRYEAWVGGQLAGIADYIPTDELVAFTHTEVCGGFEGKGVAAAMLRTALADVRSRDLSVLAVCPFVKQYIQRHPQEYADLLYQSRTRIVHD